MTRSMLGGAAALATLFATPAFAVPDKGLMQALVVAGAPYDVEGPGTADSPAARIDANVATSPYSGVVAIAVSYPDAQAPGGTGFLQCTGSLIDATHVLSAAHCVDLQGNGTAININQPGYAVTVLFNTNGAYNGGTPGQIVPASNVVIHPDYNGFGVCPVGLDNTCYNDDLSVITLSQPAPADAQIYALSRDVQAEGTTFTQVGYGITGDGWSGYTALGTYSTKRWSTNNYDLTELDDEYGLAGGAAEVWYADFDGIDPMGNDLDLFCALYGVCTGSLGNQSEGVTAQGDSGGPSFIRDANGKLYLTATNTFGGPWFEGWLPGSFGTSMGGILTYSYLDWIFANSDAENVPEPAMLGLFGLGVIAIAASRRRRKVAL